MNLMRYWRAARRLYVTQIKTRTPWYQRRLYQRGVKFARNYSDEGDARLFVWPCEGDDVPLAGVGNRHYEYPYVIASLCRYGLVDKDILDVGSAGSLLPAMIAALGSRVTCVDLRDWPIQWPGLRFVRGDLLASSDAELLPQTSFDAITCISAIEHFGLGRYGDIEDVDGDIKALAKLRDYLKPSGLLILTVPFGRGAIAFPAHRIYDRSRLARLTTGFATLDEVFFGPVERPEVYRPCAEDEAYALDATRGHTVVCCVVQKTE